MFGNELNFKVAVVHKVACAGEACVLFSSQQSIYHRSSQSWAHACPRGGPSCCKSCGWCGYRVCKRTCHLPFYPHRRPPHLQNRESVLENSTGRLAGARQLVFIESLLGGTLVVIAKVALVAAQLVLALQVTPHVVSFVCHMTTQSTREFALGRSHSVRPDQFWRQWLYFAWIKKRQNRDLTFIANLSLHDFGPCGYSEHFWFSKP